MSLQQMSISGAILIMAVVVIRAVTINKLPKKTFLILWGVALLRLLIPFSIPSMFSIYSLVRQGTASPVMIGGNAAGGNTAALQQTQFELYNENEPLTERMALTENMASAGSLWLAVWYIGIIACAVIFVISYLRCRMEFQTSLPVCNPDVEQWLKEHSLKRPIAIRQSDKITAPLTYGVFHPVILMPKRVDWTDTKQLRYVLTHEYVHICRYDAVTKLIAALALCIHWVNPMVWIMYCLLNRDIELACDESVVRRFGETSKSAYSLMLISMEARKSGFLPFCSSFSKNAIEERIIAIMKIKKTTLFSLTLACLIVAGTAAAFATSSKLDNSYASAEEKDRALNAVEKAAEAGTYSMVSYVDPQDNKAYYSMDNGKTFEPLTDEEFEQRFPTPDIEWWTYEEYKKWLAGEKKKLQELAGEKGKSASKGEFVWTQEMIDETIAVYEKILEEIKNGLLISKTVNSGTGEMISYDPADIVRGTFESAMTLCVKLSNGEKAVIGPYENADEMADAVKTFCEEEVRKGNLDAKEASEIMDKYVLKKGIRKE